MPDRSWREAQIEAGVLLRGRWPNGWFAACFLKRARRERVQVAAAALMRLHDAVSPGACGDAMPAGAGGACCGGDDAGAAVTRVLERLDDPRPIDDAVLEAFRQSCDPRGAVREPLTAFLHAAASPPSARWATWKRQHPQLDNLFGSAASILMMVMTDDMTTAGSPAAGACWRAAGVAMGYLARLQQLDDWLQRGCLPIALDDLHHAQLTDQRFIAQWRQQGGTIPAALVEPIAPRLARLMVGACRQLPRMQQRDVARAMKVLLALTTDDLLRLTRGELRCPTCPGQGGLRRQLLCLHLLPRLEQRLTALAKAARDEAALFPQA